jgi:hypothetical protein
LASVGVRSRVAASWRQFQTFLPAAGAIAAMFLSYWRFRTWDLLYVGVLHPA